MSVIALRPRFLPDRDALREWGAKGASVVRLIRKGFPVPPSAAMGISQIQEWVGSMPEYRALMACVRANDGVQPALETLRAAILSQPMPEHWGLSASTLRRLLCGDIDEEAGERWPMFFRVSVEAGQWSKGLQGAFTPLRVNDTSAEGLWSAFLQILASAWSDRAFQAAQASALDPEQYRVAVLIHPFLFADQSGVHEGGDGAVLPFAEALRKRARKAESVFGRPVALEWLWDGEQLWFVQARESAALSAVPSSAELSGWKRLLRWLIPA